MSASPIRDQFAQTMLEVGAADSDLVVLVGDISHFKLQPFAQACPGRFYNIGICEPTMVSMAAGLAKVGLIPVAHTIAPFLLERSFEQIKLDFGYHQLGGNLITVGSAFDYANLGCTHHCYDDFALLGNLPGTQLFYPGSAVEFDTLFRQVYRRGRLNLFRLPAIAHQQTWNNDDIIPGKAILVQEGSDLTIITTGPHLTTALAAQDELRQKGFHPEIIYIHTIVPLDRDQLLASVQKTRRILVVEEHVFHGGLSSRVLELVRGIRDLQFSSLCLSNEFATHYGSYEDQCRRVGLTKEGILRHVLEKFSKN